MQSLSHKKFRGISGVVIAVLLAVIGIAAVLMFWSMISGFFNPQPKVIIEKATITKIGKDTYDVSITVREVGGASTTITDVRIFGPDLNDNGEPITISTGSSTGGSSSNTGGSNTLVLSPGSSITITGKISKQLQPGVTYYVAVYYTKGDINERSDLYPVTVR